MKATNDYNDDRQTELETLAAESLAEDLADPVNTRRWSGRQTETSTVAQMLSAYGIADAETDAVAQAESDGWIFG